MNEMPNISNYGNDQKCPYCENRFHFYYGESEFAGDYCFQEVSCLTCERNWHEIYKLIGVRTEAGETFYLSEAHSAID